MAHETVLTETSGFDADLSETFAKACSTAKVRPVFWNSAHGTNEFEGFAPSLLAAALPAGERRVPPDLAEVVTKTFPQLPMLLLCNEELNRNSVTLDGGRITLLGLPLSREKISSRIRTALAPKPVPAANAESPGSFIDESEIHLGVRVREYRGPRWWAARISRLDLSALTDPKDYALFPYLDNSHKLGFASCVPAASTHTVDMPAFEKSVQALRSIHSPSEVSQAQLDKVHTEVAAVCLSPAANRWTFYSPTRERQFWLHSSLRIPNSWNVSMRSGTGLRAARSLKAGSGDLVVITSNPPDEESLLGKITQQQMENGGPSLLDFLERELRKSTSSFSAVIVEVR